METIKLYKNKVFKTIEELIYFYFKHDNPATYFPDTNEKQCLEGRRRSVNDMTKLVNYYFPDTSEEKVINTIGKIGNENFGMFIVACHVCEDINDFVFTPAYYDRNDFNFINNTILTTKNYTHRPNYLLDYQPKNSEYTFKDMLKIFKRNDL